MNGTRREFLERGGLAVVGAALASTMEAQNPPAAGAPPPQATGATPPQAAGQTVPETPGTPTVFGTSPAVGPVVTPEDFAHAEKLMQVSLTPAERAEAAGNWQQSMAAVVERRVGPRTFALGEADAPATVWRPAEAARLASDPNAVVIDAGNAAANAVANAVANAAHGSIENHDAASQVVVTEGMVRLPLPQRDADIAFSSVAQLGVWLKAGKLSAERLTKIYLARLKQYQPKLLCTITLCEEHALAQARAADAEIAAGRYRGALHGIPYGAKDLIDTAGIRTTWGAEFYRERVPVRDAHVIEKLNAAGAVLVAKLSLGALALNDIWFGGQTRNPWNLDEGASGSSAGPGAAVAAGLVGFAIGSETQGSIISPSMRCGVTGLRPTFGRVGRSGAMTLSWTCDKLGPMARTVGDVELVLAAIAGYDRADTGSVRDADFAAGLRSGAQRPRIGVVEAWMKDANAVETKALAVLREQAEVVPVTLPDWPYDSLNVILFAESAAAFEAMTLDHRLDQLRMQVPDAWPNTFRQSRFLSAVDLVQADRMRRRVAVEMERVFEQVDMLLVPSLRDEPLVIFNFTGHPSLTLRAGFVEVSEERSDWAPSAEHPLKKFSPPRRVPHGVTLIGRLFGEGAICAAGERLEARLGVAAERPTGFA